MYIVNSTVWYYVLSLVVGDKGPRGSNNEVLIMME